MFDENKDPLKEAKEELAVMDKLPMIEQLHMSQHPKWERILRSLVNGITDKTMRF